jgi:hypothetical protein
MKGVLHRLNEIGITNARSDSRHHVARYVAVFRNLPATKHTSGLLNQLARLFSETVIAQINLLDSLVPEYPAAGALAARNHEYPFQKTIAQWRAPSEVDIFTSGEIRRIRNCAGSLIVGLRRILDALDLLFP